MPERNEMVVPVVLDVVDEMRYALQGVLFTYAFVAE
jgi:hypothetical protein